MGSASRARLCAARGQNFHKACVLGWMNLAWSCVISRCLGLVVAIVCATVSTADSASAKKIKQVLEAKMACAKAPSDLTIGPKFLSHVKRTCEGKTECSVGPGELFAAADMEGWGCN